jgi:GNAT superfamily N-acetyltransferase
MTRSVAQAPKRSDGAKQGRQVLIRHAAIGDVAMVAEALASLLTELGGIAPPAAEMERAAEMVIREPDRGCLLLAMADESLVGVLAASWQHAIHVPGTYGIVQDLWVHPVWRAQKVGSTLLQALFAKMRERGIYRVEVGLPTESFKELDATARFYRENGFSLLGPRMRQVLR